MYIGNFILGVDVGGFGIKGVVVDVIIGVF